MLITIIVESTDPNAEFILRTLFGSTKPNVDSLLAERFGTSQDGNDDGVDVDLGCEADYVDHMNKNGKRLTKYNVETRNTVTGATSIVEAYGETIADAMRKVGELINRFSVDWEVVR